MLIDMAPCEELFHTAAGTAFAEMLVDGHRETWPIRSKRFRGWLRRHYYAATGGAASAAEIRSALDLLEARAQFDGPQRAVHVRIAEHAGHIYLDLADERWRAVDIGPDGWRVIGCPPVRFRQPSGMLPLPMPQQGGSIESLNSFLNVTGRDEFALIVAWLLAALRPGGPYPLLALSGEQGSAKTVLSKMLKALIDPNAAPVRSLSREERELMIAANNGYLLAFDNLSGLPVWLSDALCRLASGGSFALELSSAVKAAPEAGSSGCKLLAHMLAAVKPVDVIDEMLIVDVASLEWEVLRWRRLKTCLIRARGLAALETLLSENLDYDAFSDVFADRLTEILQENFPDNQAEDAQTLAHECARNEPDAVRKVNEILDGANLDMDRILENAKLCKADELAQAYVRHESEAVRLVDEHVADAGTSMDTLLADALAGKLDDIERVDRLTAVAEGRRNASLREIDRRRVVLGETLRRTVQEVDEKECKLLEPPAKGEKAA